jgi:hypothetical protein
MIHLSTTPSFQTRALSSEASARDLESSFGGVMCGTKAGFQLAPALRFGLAGMTGHF